MGEFAYTTVPGKIKSLLDKIRVVGVPPTGAGAIGGGPSLHIDVQVHISPEASTKVTVQWLKTIGFTSSNDKTLIGVLKQAELIDASGVPTSTWTAFRGGKHKSVLGDATQIDQIFASMAKHLYGAKNDK